MKELQVRNPLSSARSDLAARTGRAPHSSSTSSSIHFHRSTRMTPIRLSSVAFALIAPFLVHTALAQKPGDNAKDAAKTPAKADLKQAAAKSTPANTCKLDKGTPTMKVKFTTSMGAFTLELNNEKAPISTENFVKYVQSGHYNGTIFHRVIDGFMIQGGGFDKDMNQKPTREAIKNEAANGLKNDQYTVAMARTNVVDSATAQFFINVKNNDFLNHAGPANFGYAVFGKVVEGTETVDKIKGVPTGNKGLHQNVPNEPVVIEKAECL
jgi:cyclophilin family peptidyl-prolyl cis-trans isomerase